MRSQVSWSRSSAKRRLTNSALKEAMELRAERLDELGHRRRVALLIADHKRCELLVAVHGRVCALPIMAAFLMAAAQNRRR